MSTWVSALPTYMLHVGWMCVRTLTLVHMLYAAESFVEQVTNSIRQACTPAAAAGGGRYDL